ncbi:hypothetical protein WJX84_004415 [Apatococcus fuscideae]|uniref:Glutathione transferase n=1 Tax=Apatococcus fuscideae TaxID=2026836 RepID=A0AAW1TFC4_9CHLO
MRQSNRSEFEKSRPGSAAAGEPVGGHLFQHSPGDWAGDTSGSTYHGSAVALEETCLGRSPTAAFGIRVMASNRVLYWGSGSPPCWRVMAALDEKKLDYESKQISFSEKGHKSEDILALNPRGQVPTFKDGPVVVNESIAALLYLEQKYPEPCLMPSPIAPQVLQRLCEVPQLQGAIIGLMQSKGDAAAFDTKIQAFKKELGYWESYLSASKFVAGNVFTLADLAFAPQVLFFVRQGASLDEYPKLKAYLADAKERPSIKSNWPPHWKDTPNQENLKGHV